MYSVVIVSFASGAVLGLVVASVLFWSRHRVRDLFITCAILTAFLWIGYMPTMMAVHGAIYAR